MMLKLFIGSLRFVYTIVFLFVLIHSINAKNFIMLGLSEAGVQETRISYRGRYVMISSSPNSQSEDSLALVQITNQIRLVELALRHGRVEDCLVTSSAKSVKRFTRDFRRFKHRHNSNSLQTIADYYTGRRNTSSLVSYSLPDSRSSNLHGHSRKESSPESTSSSMESPSLSSKSPSSVSLSPLLPMDGQLYSHLESLYDLNIVHPTLRQYLRIGKQVNKCRKFYDSVVEHLGVPKSEFPSNRTVIDPFQHPHAHSIHPRNLCCSNPNDPVTYRASNHNPRSSSSDYSDNLNSHCQPCSDLHEVDTASSHHVHLHASPRSSFSDALSQSEKSRLVRHTSRSKSQTSSDEQGRAHPRIISGHHLMDYKSVESITSAPSGRTKSEQIVEEQDKSSKDTLSRSKRDLLTGWMIFPGTKWCGDGDIAENKYDLGYHAKLDKCCRRHDLCQVIIPRLTWKYGIFNYRLHTLCHCRCDRKFRKCLQRSGSPMAHLIGRIYFNVIGPECFKFSQESACEERHWWGTCKKWASMKVAIPRRQRQFKIKERRRRRKYKGHDNRIL